MFRLFSLKNNFCLVILIMLMTSIGARGVNLYWMSHEFVHERVPALAKSTDHLPAQQLSDAKEHGQESLSETQHQLLHSASHVEPAHIPALSEISAVNAGDIVFWLTLQAVPPSIPERTFRPPRIAITV